jgi:hypothetical protein
MITQDQRRSVATWCNGMVIVGSRMRGQRKSDSGGGDAQLIKSKLYAKLVIQRSAYSPEAPVGPFRHGSRVGGGSVNMVVRL